MNIDVGCKVICIEDNFSPRYAGLYDQWVVKDRVYVVRAVRLGVNMVPKLHGDVSLLLIGVVNGCNHLGLEHGFSVDRFRRLDEAQHEGEGRVSQTSGKEMVTA